MADPARFELQPYRGLGPSTGAHRGGFGDRRESPPVEVAPDHDELAVLQEMCRAFPSTASWDEAGQSIVRWVRAALGNDDLGVRVTVPSEAGSLERVLVEEGPWDESMKQADLRDSVFEEKRGAVAELDSSNRRLRLFPLVCRGEPVGVLEIVGLAAQEAGRAKTLDAVIGQTAALLNHLKSPSRDHASSEGDIPKLLRAMIRSPSPAAAVQTSLEYCNKRFGVLAAAWIASESLTALQLVGSAGLAEPERARLASERVLPTAEARIELQVAFARVAGTSELTLLTAGDITLIAQTPSHNTSDFAEIMALLDDVLWSIATVSRASRRNQQLDLGIAVTAHELRGPLLAASTALSHALDDQSADSSRLLHDSLRELEASSSLVGDVLRWSTGDQKLTFESVDLVALVNEAVDSCTLESREGRVAVIAPEMLPTRAAATNLRGAIANLVRNALWYSPRDTKVTVLVEAAGDHAVVSITDEGPGIPPEERDSIFEPLVRGATGSSPRHGKGLGLFVVRRVAEAHGGTVGLVAEEATTFRLEIPLREPLDSNHRPPG